MRMATIPLCVVDLQKYELASKKFKTAIEEIDKTIDHLQKTKDALLGSENNLRLANNKADDLTENTEEIILTRQKNAVQNAEFQLKVAELDYKRTMEVSLPRETVSLANAERDSALALDKAGNLLVGTDSPGRVLRVDSQGKGFLLQGGFGWSSRACGVACQSVIGIDVVLADGTLVHASETENAELLWAARGAGPGFFGIVVGFHLRLQPRPKFVGMKAQVFRIRHLEAVMAWADHVGPSVAPSAEFQLVLDRKAMGIFAHDPGSGNTPTGGVIETGD